MFSAFAGLSSFIRSGDTPLWNWLVRNPYLQSWEKGHPPTSKCWCKFSYFLIFRIELNAAQTLKMKLLQTMKGKRKRSAWSRRHRILEIPMIWNTNSHEHMMKTLPCEMFKSTCSTCCLQTHVISIKMIAEGRVTSLKSNESQDWWLINDAASTQMLNKRYFKITLIFSLPFSSAIHFLFFLPSSSFRNDVSKRMATPSTGSASSSSTASSMTNSSNPNSTSESFSKS